MRGGGRSRGGGRGAGAFRHRRKGDAGMGLDLHTQKDPADQLYAITDFTNDHP